MRSASTSSASAISAVMFGGACAGLAGAHLSLVYTPQWVENMTAGRGWIALALVVFASWRPWRVLAGAYLFGAITIAQLHTQALGFGIPSQFLSSLPYLATVDRSRSNLAQQAADDDEHAGLARPAVRARTVDKPTEKTAHLRKTTERYSNDEKTDARDWRRRRRPCRSAARRPAQEKLKACWVYVGSGRRLRLFLSA